MVDYQFSQQIALAFGQISIGANAEITKPVLANLPFDTPDILIAAPQIVEPRLGTLFLNLGDLVLDAEHQFTLAEAEGLHLAVLTVLVVLAEGGDEAVFVEIDFIDSVIEREIDP